MSKHFLRILTLLLVTLVTATASAQVAQTDKALVTLRNADRTPVTQLVNNFLQYQRLQQWDLLYDLFSPTYIRAVTRTEYVMKRQTITIEGHTMFILDFAPRRVLVNDPFDGQYSLVGCANVFSDGQVQFTNAHIDLIFESDVWRIADYGMFMTCQPPELECKK